MRFCDCTHTDGGAITLCERHAGKFTVWVCPYDGANPRWRLVHVGEREESDEYFVDLTGTRRTGAIELRRPDGGLSKACGITIPAPW